MKKSYFIHILFGFLPLMTACQKEEVLENESATLEDEEQDGVCSFNIATRGLLGASETDYQNTTYRAQLFYRGVNYYYWQRLDSLITPYTGTYCNPKGTNTWLTPCAVETTDYTYDSSASPAEDSQYGLRAGRNHDYYLFLCSPAVPFVHYGTDVVKDNPLTPTPNGSVAQAKLEYWGLQYERDGAAKTHPAVSPAAIVTTSGVNLQDTYRYNLDDDMALKEYRSRIAFSVRCGDAISHANFKKLEIKGLRKNSVLNPFTKKFYFEDKTENYEDVVVYTCSDAKGVKLERGGSEGAYTVGESQSLTGALTNEPLADTQKNEYFTYVLSEDYKSLKKVGDSETYINTPPSLYVTLVSDADVDIDVDPVLLPFVFEPQKSYFYMITINSVYLAISVTVRDWNTSSTVDEEINEDIGETYTFTVSDWTKYENTASLDKSDGASSSDPATINTINPNDNTDKPKAANWNTQSGGDSTVE